MSADPAPQGADGPRRAHPARRALAVSLGTLLVLLLVGEIGLRVAGDRRRTFEDSINTTNRRWMELVGSDLFESVDDPVRRYAMRPDAEAVVDDWTFRVTSHRTRGEDFPAAKPEGERRLVCLGDSFAFGLWSDEDESLVGHLARLANEAEAAAGSGVTWRGVNLGVPGYHTGQQLRSLEQEGLALDPDVVVVYYNANDINREGFFYDDELHALRGDHTHLPVWLKRIAWRSHLYGWYVHKVNERYLAMDGGRDTRQPWSPLREDNRAYTAESLARIVELCRERDIGVFFVNQPLMTYATGPRNPDWNMHPVVAWASETAESLDLPHVNLLAFQQGFADNVARRTEDGLLEEPDFWPMQYFADEAVQEFVQAYRAYQEALARGEEAVPPALEQPAEPDFHLTGEGYGHMARIVYEAMRAERLVP
jgi:lysophospholipase L1-like esterase